MRKALLVSALTGAALLAAAPAATADTTAGFCVEVEGNGTVLVSGPMGTKVHGFDVEYYPGRCTQTANEAVALLLTVIEGSTL